MNRRRTDPAQLFRTLLNKSRENQRLLLGYIAYLQRRVRELQDNTPSTVDFTIMRTVDPQNTHMLSEVQDEINQKLAKQIAESGEFGMTTKPSPIPGHVIFRKTVAIVWRSAGTPHSQPVKEDLCKDA